MRVTVIGAGVAGLTCAVELAERGVRVAVLERASELGAGACAWQAGGMLAPWCERENAEPVVATLGEESSRWWMEHFDGVVNRGSLVVAHGRDSPELTSFARRTERFAELNAAALAELEPDLAGRFSRGLYFASEAHLDPRAALLALANRLRSLGMSIRFGVDGAQALSLDRTDAPNLDRHSVLDCRGLAATQTLGDLRGVRGEAVLLRQREVHLTRPIRLLHPRTPLYIVPRGDGLYYVGATTIESDDAGRITARSLLELLGAAYTVHPAFGAAEVVETLVGIRPAFPDNLPRIGIRGAVITVNGLYRHGFLLAPALAMQVAATLTSGALDENLPERRSA